MIEKGTCMPIVHICEMWRFYSHELYQFLNSVDLTFAFEYTYMRSTHTQMVFFLKQILNFFCLRCLYIVLSALLLLSQNKRRTENAK